MPHDLDSLVNRILGLLDRSKEGAHVALLTEMEHTLTDGYARALEIETERLRLERRIGELAHNVKGADEAARLRVLVRQLRALDEDLASLRDALAPLQRRVDAERAAA